MLKSKGIEFILDRLMNHETEMISHYAEILNDAIVDYNDVSYEA